MTSEWRDATIGDLCDSGEAELQTGPFGTQLHASDYVDAGVAIVPTEAVRNRRINHSALPKVSAEKAEDLARHRLRVGDILFARRGVQATGHVGYVTSTENGFLAGTGVIRLRLIEERSITSEYLSHVLADSRSVDWFKFHAIGATMPNLNEGIIRSFPLIIPPLPEQRAIAEVLGALDDKIEVNERMNATLDEMARALFKSWFVDFDPVRAKAEGRQPSHMDPATAALFPASFEDSPLGPIPAGWRVSTVGEVVSVFGGSTPSTKEPAFWDGEHAFATPKDLSQISTPILLDTARRVTDAGLAKIGRGLMPPDTVLMSSRAPVGYLAITRLPVTVNQGMAAMVCDRELRAPFVLNWTRENMAEVHSRASGSTFAEISKSAFREIPCVVPPPHVHDAYHVSAATMYDLMTANAQESRTLAEVRDALLPRLISGELRVRDPERAVEAAV